MNYLEQTRERMAKALEKFEQELANVRTGRANAAILERITVDYYGEMTPLNQIGSITVVEGRQLVIKPYDGSFLKEIEKRINMSDLGLVPVNDGTIIRLNVPSLTEETRKTIVKGLGKTTEEAKIAIRNVRRDINDLVKKDAELSENMQKDLYEDIQKITNDYIKQIDALTEVKSQEVMTI